MTPPNIEMIAASLRNCSMGRERSAPPPPELLPPPPRLLDPADENAAGVTVELNSEEALPHPWEQCLDIQTGEVYYINWRTGTRTTEDPRTSMPQPETYYSSSEDDSTDDDSSDEDDYGDRGDTTGYSSSPSPPEASSGVEILVAAGCKACFMYFMVPKHVEACPKCGAALLHLGRN